jgi:hypothetical protein
MNQEWILSHKILVETMFEKYLINVDEHLLLEEFLLYQINIELNEY